LASKGAASNFTALSRGVRRRLFRFCERRSALRPEQRAAPPSLNPVEWCAAQFHRASIPYQGDIVTEPYQTPGPSRSEIDSASGPVLLEFGTAWCGHCQAAEPAVSAALAKFPAVQHVKVEDGPGRKLGRSFGIKLWPTLICLKDGAEVARLVRPESAASIQAALSRIA
jgi:thioredoxin 1